jgi:hypothetical protein
MNNRFVFSQSVMHVTRIPRTAVGAGIVVAPRSLTRLLTFFALAMLVAIPGQSQTPPAIEGPHRLPHVSLIAPQGEPAVDVPGAQGTFPYDINDREEIVGEYQDAAGASHGFRECHGRFTTVDYPGAVATSIFGNNDRGDLAGQWLDSAGTYHGFVAFEH